MTVNESMRIAAARQLWRKAKKDTTYTSHLDLMISTALSAATIYRFKCSVPFNVYVP